MRSAMSRLLFILSCVLPGVIVASIWLPVVEHFYVPRIRIPEASLGDFVNNPSDATMELLGRQFLGVEGETPLGFPADSPEERLLRAGLFQVGTDLGRFAQTGDQTRFRAITRNVVEFSRRASSRFAYDEFLWNDHAIANRVFVLAKFWRHYRRSAHFEAEDALQILQHVVKNVQFLERDDHFTYWSNHGVMQ